MQAHWSRWVPRTQWVIVGSMLVAAVLLRQHLVGFRPVFSWFQYAGLAAVLIGLFCTFLFGWGVRMRNPEVRRNAIVGLFLGLLPLGVVLLSVGQKNFAVPPIHDITTDTVNPPQYRVALTARAPGENSLEYAGEALALQQLEAYPDLSPLFFELPAADVTRLAAEVALAQGWQILARDESAGYIEAVATTPLLRFRDDVVIRVVAEGQGSRVDVRSSSRVGVSDLGANAERIRVFSAALKEAVAAEGRR
ncbi:DUF1499 domain-containing protein [Biformimicrobium ophioploci]|nr:DUF1499 domain-containing protein [Microbulbifer sp. NKW57]